MNTAADCIVMSFPYSTFWSDIYHESIVQHDHRLRSICSQTPWVSFDEIIDADWIAAKNDDRIASNPIAIYLNKFAPKSQKFKRMNKDVIYQRQISVSEYDRNQRNRYISGLRACSRTTVDPRNRWFKLYERNPRFTSTISALSTQLHSTIQAQSQITQSVPTETNAKRSITPMEKYSKCYKVRIFHRQASNWKMEGASFPSIWKEQDQFALVDDVSGVALRHITLLCRDVICECNKCTVGCPSGESGTPGRCDVCQLEYQEYIMRHVQPSMVFCGSFAEGCMLPTFFVCNEFGIAIKKSSDIDKMIDSRGRVGFNVEIDSNIFATIETGNCEPGYFRLRVVSDGQIFRLSENIEFIGNTVQDRINVRIIEKSYYKKSFTRGPATTNIAFKEPNRDKVYYYSCSSWPQIAQPWIDRERPSKWPPKEIIREIVSKGCRIVHKPHPSSKDPDAEFRFSFSVAELFLFDALSVDQKKCFIAFKALVKCGICRSKIITKNKIDLCTYHLKTIFLWTCETIPVEQWQTTTGWARCLLYMIDQLYACLKSRILPGYFIPESNLLDSIELPQILLNEMRKLRMDPMTSAATFLDSTRCLRHSRFKILDHIQDFYGFDLIEEIVLGRQFIFLQKMTIEMDSTRGVALWKKEAVLKIFATWCHQNSHEIHLTPWQCLAREMTLFDVVYLDILHGFDVPTNVLLEYVDREWSADVVCKLAICYSMKALKREDRKNQVEYSLHFKTLLMVHRTISYKFPTLESIITSVSILMRCDEYEMAAKVLESAIPDCLSERICIRWKKLYADLLSHKLNNEIQEMSDILKYVGWQIRFCQAISTLICFSLSVCYKYSGDEEKRGAVLDLIAPMEFSCLNNQKDHFCFMHFEYVYFMLEVFDNSEKWKTLAYNNYRQFMSMKIKLIKEEAKERKDALKRIICDHQSDRYVSLKAYSSMWSCNVEMITVLKNLDDYLRMFNERAIDVLNEFELKLTYSMTTTVDRICFSQVLILERKLEQAISILKAVVEQEGDFSISMVIWPKELYRSGLIDDNLRNELMKSSDDYIVFPTNLYARYLLTIAYNLLGQEENRSNNLAELVVLRERYSQVQEFAPMLKIMSAVAIS